MTEKVSFLVKGQVKYLDRNGTDFGLFLSWFYFLWCSVRDAEYGH